MKFPVFLILLCLPISALSQTTGVAFQTQSVIPVGGDIFDSLGDPLTTAIISYGTFDTLDTDGVVAALGDPGLTTSEFDTLLSDYSEIGFTAFSNGDVNTGTIEVSQGTEVWFWVFDTASTPSSSLQLSEVALFGPLSPPAGLGVTGSNPTSIVLNNQLYLGISPDSTNIYLEAAVPEPATYTLIFGIFGLSLVLWKHRRSQ